MNTEEAKTLDDVSKRGLRVACFQSVITEIVTAAPNESQADVIRSLSHVSCDNRIKSNEELTDLINVTIVILTDW